MPRYRKIDNSQANRNLVNANIKLVDENKDLKYKMNKAIEYINLIEEKFATEEFISIDKKLVDLEHIKEIKKILQ